MDTTEKGPNLKKLRNLKSAGKSSPKESGSRTVPSKQLSLSRFFTERSVNTSECLTPDEKKVKKNILHKRKSTSTSPDENVLYKKPRINIQSNQDESTSPSAQGTSAESTETAQIADSTMSALQQFSASPPQKEQPPAHHSSKDVDAEVIVLDDHTPNTPPESVSERSILETASTGTSSNCDALAAFQFKQSSRNDSSSSKQSSFGSSLGKGRTYTPLEKQFMVIKEKNPDAVLFVECGYRYRFFGEDAVIAAKELNIFAHHDHNFMSASIPTHRLFVHTRRLVAKGYKVGVVKQVETAALKAVGDNKNAPFERKLVALYTKSTLIGYSASLYTNFYNGCESHLNSVPDVSDGEEVDIPMSSTPNSFLLCLKEFQKAGTENIEYGLIAIQPSTGEVIFDSFHDNQTFQALDTRIHHIQPVELLLPTRMSARTEKFLKDIVCSSINEIDRIRVERVPEENFDQTQAFQEIKEFFGKDNKHSAKLQEIIGLPPPVVCCVSAVLKYLKEFKLDKILRLTSNFRPFSEMQKNMKLNACTLRNLEIFENQVDRSSNGTLFWLLDHTKTKFGCRKLRSWISKPLLDKSDIEKRQLAVEDIMKAESSVITKMNEYLHKVPDLERGLCNIYHKKCSYAEFYNIVKKLQQAMALCAGFKEVTTQTLQSTLLLDMFKEIPDLLKEVPDFMNALNEEAARAGDKTKLFADPSQFGAVSDCLNKISAVEARMLEHRREVRLLLRMPSLDYVIVSGNEYLIEVKNAQIKAVPTGWIKISATKQVSRFRPPMVERSYKELCQLREKLNIACSEAWMQFLESFGEKYFTFRQAVSHLATYDCLYALAEVAKQNNFVRPVIQEGPACIHIRNGRHPIINSLLGEGEQFVPNSTNMKTEEERCMIITGPNMGGKSSYIKQVALVSILAQIGSFVPAEEAHLTPLDAIYTRMGSSDNIYKNRSTFMVELQEASVILKEATSQSLVILDELGRGTSTHDGVAIAHATANYLIEDVGCLTLFVTHYPWLADLEQKWPGKVGNYHMSFIINDAEDQENLGTVDILTFLYQLVRGVASRSYGLNVARLAEIPESVLKVAGNKSRELESNIMEKSKQRESFKRAWSISESQDFKKIIL